MKYIIDNENEFNTAEKAADYIIDNMSEDSYDDMLDECYGEIEICGISYSASIALFRVDEIAYYCGFNDYKDIERSNIIDELETMDSSDEVTFFDYVVTVQDEEGE